MENATTLLFGYGTANNIASFNNSTSSQNRGGDVLSGADDFTSMFQNEYQGQMYDGGKSAITDSSYSSFAPAADVVADNPAVSDWDSEYVPVDYSGETMVAEQTPADAGWDGKNTVAESKDSAGEESESREHVDKKGDVAQVNDTAGACNVAADKKDLKTVVKDNRRVSSGTEDNVVAVSGNRNAKNVDVTTAAADKGKGVKIQSPEENKSDGSVVGKTTSPLRDSAAKTTLEKDAVPQKSTAVRNENSLKDKHELPTAASNASAVAEANSAVQAAKLAAAATVSGRKTENTASRNTAHAEDVGTKTDRSFSEITGIKIHSVSVGNSQIGNAANQTRGGRNGASDGSAQEGNHLLNSLAEKSSRLQQKLHSQAAANNSENSSNAGNTMSKLVAGATKTVEVAGKGLEKQKTVDTANDKTAISGMDMSRQNSIAERVRATPVAQTSAALTEKVASLQQLAEKIGSVLRGTDNLRGQSVSLDFETESMGRLQMFVQQNGGSIKIVFEPGSESCRQQLQDQQEELARHLRNMGYQECSLDIADSRDQKQSSGGQEKNSFSGNDDAENVKLAGSDQADLLQILAM